MDSSVNNPPKQNSHHYSYFTLQEFNAIATIFLEYYEDGKYSDEGVSLGESTAGQRKTLKHQFKDHILGDSKYIKAHNGEHKKWSRYTGCLLKALLESDTMRVIEKNRKIRELNKKLKDEIAMREQIIQVRVSEATKFVMNDARATVDDELRERADRIEGRFKKYQETQNKYQKENEMLRQELATCVSRETFDEATTTMLSQKLEIEKLRGKKKEPTPEEKKLLKIKKKKKELKELLETVNISDSDDSSSSDED